MVLGESLDSRPAGVGESSVEDPCSRWCQQFPNVPREVVAEVVHRYDGAIVPDFVPIFIQRDLREISNLST